MESEQMDESNKLSQEKMDWWIKKNSHLNPNFFQLSDIKFKPDINDDGWIWLQNYNEFKDRFGFIFHGNAGVGKSLLMKRICIRALKLFSKYDYPLVKNIVFMPMGIYMTKVRENFQDANSVETNCLESQFLYLDDIGTEYKTEFANEKLFTLLDYRVAKELPTFITTNLSLSEIKNTYGERIHSRINELCVPIQVRGDDQRKKILAERMKMLLERNKEECIHIRVKEEVNQESIDKLNELIIPREF